MIIDEVPEGLDLSNPNVNERDSYFCRWFKGSTTKSGCYAEELLELVDTKKELQSKGKQCNVPLDIQNGCLRKNKHLPR